MSGDELADEATVVRWVGPGFVLCAVVLLPWIGWLAVTLPPRSVSGHYALAWSGFDAFLAAGLLATGWTARLRSPWLALAATATSTLLVVDAWFDVLTSAEKLDQIQAIVLAAAVELPLAGLCAWLAWHTEELVDRRLALALLHRPIRRRRGGRARRSRVAPGGR